MQQSLAFPSKKWLIPGAIVATILTGLLVVPSLIDINSYRGQLASQLEAYLGRQVTFGSLHLSLLPAVKIRVDDLVIGEDPQFTQGPFIKARSAHLRISFWSLLAGKPEARSIELVDPVLMLIKEKKERWNWGALKPLRSIEPGRAPAAMNLIVHNGRFTLIDRTLSPHAERTYTGVDLEIENYSPQSATDFALAITMPGQGAGRLKAKGAAGPFDPKDFTRTPFDMQVEMQQVELASLEALLDQKSPRSGRITLDAGVKGKLAEGFEAKGEITVEKLKLVAGAEASAVPIGAEFKLIGTAQEKSDYTVKIAEGDLKLGNTRARLTGQISHLLTNPTLDLKLDGDSVSLDGLLAAANAFGFGPPPGTSASGTASMKVQAAGPLDGFALDGQSEIRELKLRSSKLPEPIQVSSVKLNFDPSAITSSPFRTTVGKRTSVEISSLSVRNYSRQPRLHLEAATQNAQLEDLLKIAESFGLRSSFSATGVATLQAAIETGLGPTAQATTITGRGQVSNARLQAPLLAQPINIAAADLSFTGDSLRAENLRAQLGKSQIAGWWQVKDFDHPAANFDLKVDQLNVAELQQLFTAPAERPARAAQQTSLIPQAIAQTRPRAARSTALPSDGQLTIGRVIYENFVATDLQSQVSFRDQILDLNPLSFNFYGGRYQGQLKVDRRESEPGLGVNGRFSGVDVNQFLSAATSLKNIVYGRAGGTLNVRSRGQQFDPQTLSGQGQLAITEGRITSFDLARQIELIGQLNGLPASGGGTTFSTLSTDLRFDHGRMYTENLRLEMSQLQVTGRGVTQLGNQATTDHQLLAHLSSALTQRVMPGGGFISSAGNFFMDQNNLAVPLKMSGPIAQPHFSLNPEGLQKQVTERFIRQPDQTVKGILDLFQSKDKSKSGGEKKKLW